MGTFLPFKNKSLSLFSEEILLPFKNKPLSLSSEVILFTFCFPTYKSPQLLPILIIHQGNYNSQIYRTFEGSATCSLCVRDFIKFKIDTYTNHVILSIREYTALYTETAR